MPGEPPTTSTEPALYFVSLARLGGTSRRISSVTSRCRVSPVSMPISATSTSPAWKRPGATTSPTFGACIVTVTSAATAAPAISPVDPSTPEGRSTATIGTGAALMRSIVCAASSRGAP
jgi:hypothetical protein